MQSVATRLSSVKTAHRPRRQETEGPKRIGLVRRWSTPNQNDNYSNERQFALMRRRCETLGYVPVEYDEGQVSGGDLLKRPKVVQLLQDIQDGVIHGIGVISLSRLSREESGSDVGFILDICIESDARIVTETAEYKARDAQHQLQIKLLSAVSSLERSTIRDTMVRGKAGRLLNGPATNASGAPLGYQHVMTGEIRASGRATRTIQRCPEDSYEYRLVTEFWRLAPTATSLMAIAHALTAQGLLYPRRRGENKGTLVDWGHKNVAKILENDIYSGTLVFESDTPRGIWQSQPEFAAGPVRREEPSLAYVDARLQQRVRERLLHHKGDVVTGTRARNSSRPLHGVLRCLHCGTTMYSAVQRGYPVYDCPTKYSHRGTCAGQCVAEHLALGAVFGLMRHFVEATMDEMEARGQGRLGADYSKSFRDAQDHLAILERRREVAIEMMTTSDPDPAETLVWQQKLRALRQQIRGAEETVATQQALIGHQQALKGIIPLGEDFVPTMMGMEWQIQRDTIRAMFASLRVQGEGYTAKRVMRVVAYQLHHQEEERRVEGPTYPYSRTTSTGGSSRRTTPTNCVIGYSIPTALMDRLTAVLLHCSA